MEVCLKQKRVTEFLHGEAIAASDIHLSLSISGDQAVDASTVMWWAVCFNEQQRVTCAGANFLQAQHAGSCSLLMKTHS